MEGRRPSWDRYATGTTSHDGQKGLYMVVGA